MPRKIRCLAAALALALCTAGAAQALPQPAHPAAAGFLDVLWHWAALHFPSSLAALWVKEGVMDTPRVTEEGGTMDPDGLTSAPQVPEEGGTMDPNG